MRRVFLCIMAMVMMSGFVKAGETIKLPLVVKGVPATLMQALEKRQSVREFDKGNIPLRELSNLLWAANGVNREDGKRTAPSALNKQDVDVYVCMENGAYKYDAKGHALVQVTDKDVRPAVAAQQTWAADAPVVIVLVSDLRKLGGEKAREMGAIDAGHVSQNVCLYCAATGLATVPRASMDKRAVATALNLENGQEPMLNLPVGYPKK
ncbi:MAG: SagB/ThcOx family dehydrogenase [bacterium]|uniref:SagB/ThcOx family dehydrogenase n=1 Tax=Candidatus Aphodosoma intestinipullorum TaxID=2840674 RepID=A0A940IEK7_9BACT|nr:SagB/ThcOx family dehydrogenase [Candidatus Aphodosoma intestinipullorum]